MKLIREQIANSDFADDPIPVARYLLTRGQDRGYTLHGRTGTVQVIPFCRRRLDLAVETVAWLLPTFSLDRLRRAFEAAASAYDARIELVTASDGEELQAWIIHPDGRVVSLAELERIGRQ